MSFFTAVKRATWQNAIYDPRKQCRSHSILSAVSIWPELSHAWMDAHAPIDVIIYPVFVKSTNRKDRTIQHTWRCGAGWRDKPLNGRSVRLIYFLYFLFKSTKPAYPIRTLIHSQFVIIQPSLTVNVNLLPSLFFHPPKYHRH